MPTITIDGREFPFEKGQTILQVALEHGIEIPHYCYHPGLSIVANCRICLAEVWAPNPRNDNKLEPIPKLMPTCQTPCGDGQVVHTSSPKSIANQKAVMEYLLINHPVDCPVCDQAGECHLQDYSYQYGRGEARFQEQKIKQPKKDVGPHVLLYSDRCIMCTRCVRFTREVTGTGELMVDGRGAMEQIDVFPGVALDNELSGNVVDLCPVGALLDKDFLFQQRVWFLKKTPSIDGLTCSGDNIYVEHNDGVVHRVKPRTNLDVNKWWITDEVRFGWKFLYADERITLPRVKDEKAFAPTEAAEAYESAYGAAAGILSDAQRIGLLVSPMLSCEDAYCLARTVAARAEATGAEVVYGVGPVPTEGTDKSFPGGYTMYAEKAPNARGVRRVLASFGAEVLDASAFTGRLGGGAKALDAVVVTGNYPSAWATDELMSALEKSGARLIVIDTLESRISARADVLLPGAIWMEKAGSFENVDGRIQAFERAVEPVDYAKGEAQIALDLAAWATGEEPERFDAARLRRTMAEERGLAAFVDQLHAPEPAPLVESDMTLVEL